MKVKELKVNCCAHTSLPLTLVWTEVAQPRERCAAL